MTDNLETLTMRPTVIGGDRLADDYEVIWRGFSIGRIMKSSTASTDKPQWSWTCHLHGRPTRGNESGAGTGLDDCKAQFRAAWERIRAGLTEADISTAHRYAEASAEALARYDRKRGG